MATTTTKWGMPKPVLGDTPNVPRDIGALADWLDARIATFSAGLIASRGAATPAERYYFATDDFTGGPDGTLYRATGAVWVTVNGAILPWLVDIDPLANAGNTNWTTLIKAEAGGSSSGTIDGNGDLLSGETVAHGIGETPTSAAITLFVRSVTAPGVSIGATNLDVDANYNGQPNGSVQGFYWQAFNNAGPARKSTGAVNAEVYWPVLMSKGTWALELLHNQGPDRGIYTVAFDGVDAGTADGYAAALTAKQRATLTGIDIPKSKLVTVRLKMSTKNPSASAYAGHISGVRLRRTA